MITRSVSSSRLYWPMGKTRKKSNYQSLNEQAMTFKAELMGEAKLKKKHQFAHFLPRFNQAFDQGWHDYDQAEKLCAGYQLRLSPDKKTGLFVKPVFYGPVCALDGNMHKKPTQAYMNNDFAQSGQRGDVYSVRSKKKVGQGHFQADRLGHLQFDVTAIKSGYDIKRLFAFEKDKKATKAQFVMAGKKGNHVR
jgi:hypothetical protein